MVSVLREYLSFFLFPLWWKAPDPHPYFRQVKYQVFISPYPFHFSHVNLCKNYIKIVKNWLYKPLGDHKEISQDLQKGLISLLDDYNFLEAIKIYSSLRKNLFPQVGYYCLGPYRNTSNSFKSLPIPFFQVFPQV